MDIQLPDLFSPDKFNVLTLTTQLNNVPYTPQFLGSFGLFAVQGVATRDIAVASRNGAIKLIPTSEWGAPPQQADRPKRDMRKASVSHIVKEGTINVGEVQDAIAQAMVAGQPQLETIEGLVADTMEGPFGLRQEFELTHEYHRLGAISGLVLDADGTSVLYDWYDFFNIAALADAEIDFDALTAEDRLFEVQCNVIKREALRECEDLPSTGARPMVLCGDNFFDKVYSNKEVANFRINRDTGRGADAFVDSLAFGSIDYGGMLFVNYRGTKNGDVGIDTDEARMFLNGVPGLFQMVFGPPDILGKTNMKGVPLFGFMPPERQTSREAVLEAQSNPLTLCTRPRSLRKLVIAP